MSRWDINKIEETIFGTTLKKKITEKICAEWVDNLIQGGVKFNQEVGGANILEFVRQK
mgnify:FL=1